MRRLCSSTHQSIFGMVTFWLLLLFESGYEDYVLASNNSIAYQRFMALMVLDEGQVKWACKKVRTYIMGSYIEFRCLRVDSKIDFRRAKIVYMGESRDESRS